MSCRIDASDRPKKRYWGSVGNTPARLNSKTALGKIFRMLGGTAAIAVTPNVRMVRIVIFRCILPRHTLPSY